MNVTAWRIPPRRAPRRSPRPSAGAALFVAAWLLLGGCSSDDSSPSAPGPDPGDLETGTVTDADGNVYPTVRIGDQWWLAANLRVTHYRNGDPIAAIPGADDWLAATAGGWASVDNDPAFDATYGLIYNGFAVADPRGLAPAGWRLPTDADWQALEDHLGAENAGGKTKATGTALWQEPNLGATNETGFTALPAGVRPPAGMFTDRGTIAFFWTTTEALGPPIVHNVMRGMGYAETTFRRQVMPLQMGLSVRCIRE